MSGDVQRELPLDAAESKTLSMLGNSLRENRETPRTSSLPMSEERSEKALGRTADMHVLGESDGFVVPAKRANKAGPMAAAESVEGREPTKGNADRPDLYRTPSRVSRASDWNAYDKRHVRIESYDSPRCCTMSHRSC